MYSASSRVSIRGKLFLWGLALAGVLVTGFPANVPAAGPPPAYNKEHTITIDPTPLVPQSWWQVPGVTPPLWVLDPETSDAYRTTETHELKLKPGQYKFISFTFDFPFTVSLDGRLEFSKSLDQCVEGRGTQTLVVRCKRTYPHGGQRDAYYGNSEVSDGAGTR
ncbi:MAG: exported protein of unknown function [Nitrospira sp.]|jgi:hypothetical protein|nr:exported protein of unknown function [Nitrospira sp.]